MQHQILARQSAAENDPKFPWTRYIIFVSLITAGMTCPALLWYASVSLAPYVSSHFCPHPYPSWDLPLVSVTNGYSYNQSERRDRHLQYARVLGLSPQYGSYPTPKRNPTMAAPQTRCCPISVRRCICYCLWERRLERNGRFCCSCYQKLYRILGQCPHADLSCIVRTVPGRIQEVCRA